MRKRVCLILDSKVLSEIISDYLIMEGYDVSDCTFGNLNMAVALAQRPDVIVLRLEHLEKFQQFFIELASTDSKSILHVPIILFSAIENELFITSAANGFTPEVCSLTDIVKTIMAYADGNERIDN